MADAVDAVFRRTRPRIKARQTDSRLGEGSSSEPPSHELHGIWASV